AGADVSLDEVARRAGVGIGTLYRHFPTRSAIVEAVYQREVQQLAEAATRLIGSLPPGEALREWMRLFVEPQLLAAMHRVERVVDVERDSFGNLLEGLAIKIDHRPAHAQQ